MSGSHSDSTLQVEDWPYMAMSSLSSTAAALSHIAPIHVVATAPQGRLLGCLQGPEGPPASQRGFSSLYRALHGHGGSSAVS